LRLGKWVQSDKYVTEAEYGYCKGRITVNSNVKFSPFFFRADYNKDLPANYATVGTWEKFISKKGIGKKTKLSNFRGQHRGGKGVKVTSIDNKTGTLAFATMINENDAILIITSAKGQVMKIPVTAIPARSRTAKGVILMRFSQKDDQVVSATFV